MFLFPIIKISHTHTQKVTKIVWYRQNDVSSPNFVLGNSHFDWNFPERFSLRQIPSVQNFKPNKVWQSFKQEKNDFVMELLGNFNKWYHQTTLPHTQKVLKILWLFWNSLAFFSSPQNSLVQNFWMCCTHEYYKWLNTTKCSTGSFSFTKEEGKRYFTGMTRPGTGRVQRFTRLFASFAMWQTFA